MYTEKFNELLTKIANSNSEWASDDFEEVTNATDSFLNYFNAVYKETVFSKRANMLLSTGRLTGEEIRDKRVEFDKSRKIAHDKCITTVALINRLCTHEYDMEPFLPIVPEDFNYDQASELRYVIADMVGNFVKETYQDGIQSSKPEQQYEGQALDEAIQTAVDKYVDGGYAPQSKPDMADFQP